MDTQDHETARTEAGPAAPPDVEPLKKVSMGFLGSALALSAGTVIAQAISILVSPVLSRLFLPEAFGIAALFFSIVSIMSLVSGLSYEFAIVLPKRDEEAANILGLGLLLNVAMAGLVTIVTAVAGEAALRAINAEPLVPYRWLVPLGVFLHGIALPMNYWNSRHNYFKRMAAATVGASVVGTCTTLGAGFLGLTSGAAMVVARMPGDATVPAVLGWRFWRDDIRFFLRHCTLRGMWEAAGRYRKFPLITSWNVLLNIASREAPTILIAAFFGPAVTGLYAVSRRILGIPSRLVSQAVGQVFFQRAAVRKAAGADLAGLVRKVACRLNAVGLLPMLILSLAGPELFGFVFGPEWTEAGLYTSILALWTVVLFVNSPLTTVYAVLERQEIGLILNILLFANRVAVLVIGGLLIKQVIPTLLLFSIVGALSCTLDIAIILKLTKAGYRAVLRNLALHVLYAVPTAGIIAGAKWGLGLQGLPMFLTVLLAAAPYAILALRQDREVREAIVRACGRVLRRG